jgi:CRP-like cAMP-binding protein
MDEGRLNAIPFFESLDRKDRRQLARLADRIELEEGKQLVREGEFAYEFFVLEDGEVEVTVGGEKVAELGSGDFFGEMGLMDKARRNATVTATSRVSVVVLTAQQFRSMSRAMPNVAAHLEREVESRCRKVNERAEAVS